MANVAWGKKILAVAVLSCLCASIAVPAYAFYYVHLSLIHISEPTRPY